MIISALLGALCIVLVVGIDYGVHRRLDRQLLAGCSCGWLAGMVVAWIIAKV